VTEARDEEFEGGFEFGLGWGGVSMKRGMEGFREWEKWVQGEAHGDGARRRHSWWLGGGFSGVRERSFDSSQALAGIVSELL